MAGISEKEMVGVCKISQRTISRMAEDQTLPEFSAEIIVSLLRTFSRAVEFSAQKKLRENG